MSDQLMICRCEEVTLHALHEAIEQGARTAKEVKLITRCSMGICQGRTCGAMIECYIAAYTGKKQTRNRSLVTQAPVRPVSMQRLARGSDEKEV